LAQVRLDKHPGFLAVSDTVSTLRRLKWLARVVITVALCAGFLAGCGGSVPSSVVLRVSIPPAREFGSLYIEVRGSSAIVSAIRRSVAAAKGSGWTVVRDARGTHNCTRSIRIPAGGFTGFLARYAGQKLSLVVSGGSLGKGDGAYEHGFCKETSQSVDLLIP